MDKLMQKSAASPNEKDESVQAAMIFFRITAFLFPKIDRG